MEQTLHSPIDAHSGYLTALRHWTRGFRAHRQHRRDMKCLAQLPDHLLRDIGYEPNIAPRTNPGVYGF